MTPQTRMTTYCICPHSDCIGNIMLTRCPHSQGYTETVSMYSSQRFHGHRVNVFDRIRTVLKLIVCTFNISFIFKILSQPRLHQFKVDDYTTIRQDDYTTIRTLSLRPILHMLTPCPSIIKRQPNFSNVFPKEKKNCYKSF